jgi:hypothetical protein
MADQALTTEPREAPLTAHEIKAQVQRIQEVMQAVMQEGQHYGTIPGTDKPTLLKPGAEKLTMTFRLAPHLHVECRELGNGHREYQVRCTLIHIPTGRVYGEGVGLCSTMESRYRYRHAERVCPHCGKAAIIKGKAEYGGGWLCFQRKGGCGAKFSEQDPAIVNQQTGRVENPDLADTYNTVLKMAKKRALTDATLTATAASDIFTQDLEDFEDSPDPATPPAQPAGAAAAPLQPEAEYLGRIMALRPRTDKQAGAVRIEERESARPVTLFFFSRPGALKAVAEDHWQELVGRECCFSFTEKQQGGQTWRYVHTLQIAGVSPTPDEPQEAPHA